MGVFLTVLKNTCMCGVCVYICVTGLDCSPQYGFSVLFSFYRTVILHMLILMWFIWNSFLEVYLVELCD